MYHFTSDPHRESCARPLAISQTGEILGAGYIQKNSGQKHVIMMEEEPISASLFVEGEIAHVWLQLSTRLHRLVISLGNGMIVLQNYYTFPVEETVITVRFVSSNCAILSFSSNGLSIVRYNENNGILFIYLNLDSFSVIRLDQGTGYMDQLKGLASTPRRLLSAFKMDFFQNDALQAIDVTYFNGLLITLSRDRKIRFLSEHTRHCIHIIELQGIDNGYLSKASHSLKIFDNQEFENLSQFKLLCYMPPSDTMDAQLLVYHCIYDLNSNMIDADRAFQCSISLQLEEQFVNIECSLLRNTWVAWVLTNDRGLPRLRSFPVSRINEEMAPVTEEIEFEQSVRYELAILPNLSSRDTPLKDFVEFLFFPGRFSSLALFSVFEKMSKSVSSEWNSLKDKYLSLKGLKSDFNSLLSHQCHSLRSDLLAQELEKVYHMVIMFEKEERHPIFYDPNQSVLLTKGGIVRLRCMTPVEALISCCEGNLSWMHLDQFLHPIGSEVNLKTFLMMIKRQPVQTSFFKKDECLPDTISDFVRFSTNTQWIASGKDLELMKRGIEWILDNYRRLVEPVDASENQLLPVLAQIIESSIQFLKRIMRCFFLCSSEQYSFATLYVRTKLLLEKFCILNYMANYYGGEIGQDEIHHRLNALSFGNFDTKPLLMNFLRHSGTYNEALQNLADMDLFGSSFNFYITVYQFLLKTDDIRAIQETVRWLPASWNCTSYLKAVGNMNEFFFKNMATYSNSQQGEMKFYTNDADHLDLARLLGLDGLDVDQYISQVCGLAIKNDQKLIAAQLCRMAKTCLPVSLVDQVGRNEFTFLLESNNLERAFSSAIRISDSTLRRLCMKQFTSVLLESNSINSSKYDLSEYSRDIEASLNYKANTWVSEKEGNGLNYYHLLYSFHMKRRQYHKAACQMYGYFKRMNTIFSDTNRQSVRKTQALLLVLNTMKQGELDCLRLSQTTMFYEEVKREYYRHLMFLELQNHMSSPGTLEEMLVVYCEHGMINRALDICDAIGLDKSIVFSNLSKDMINQSFDDPHTFWREIFQKIYKESIQVVAQLLDRVLMIHPNIVIPQWIIDRFMECHIGLLINLLVKYKLTKEMTQFMVKFIVLKLTYAKATEAQSIPYSSIDQIIPLLSSEESKELREAVKLYIAKLDENALVWINK